MHGRRISKTYLIEKAEQAAAIVLSTEKVQYYEPRTLCAWLEVCEWMKGNFEFVIEGSSRFSVKASYFSGFKQTVRGKVRVRPDGALRVGFWGAYWQKVTY